MMSLKINRLLSIYTSIVLQKFAVDNQSQPKVKGTETKKKIQYDAPDGHFESDVVENQ